MFNEKINQTAVREKVFRIKCVSNKHDFLPKYHLIKNKNCTFYPHACNKQQKNSAALFVSLLTIQWQNLRLIKIATTLWADGIHNAYIIHELTSISPSTIYNYIKKMEISGP